MFNFWTVVYLIFIGVIAGYLARLLVKGSDPMTWWQTILLGIVGSFIGGFGAYRERCEAIAGAGYTGFSLGG